MMTKYQIAFNSPAGVEPQKYEIYDTKEEAEELCRKYNEQDNNPYGYWVVIKKQYI